MIYYLKNPTTGQVGLFACQQKGWIELSEAEIESYKLQEAKKEKISGNSGLKKILNDYLETGFAYGDNTFKLTENVLNNIERKKDTSVSNPNKYVFCNNKHQRVDFRDQADFDLFQQALVDDQDRVMIKYNDYYAEITAIEIVPGVVTFIEAMAQLAAIKIDFSV